MKLSVNVVFNELHYFEFWDETFFRMSVNYCDFVFTAENRDDVEELVEKRREINAQSEVADCKIRITAEEGLNGNLLRVRHTEVFCKLLNPAQKEDDVPRALLQ